MGKKNVIDLASVREESKNLAPVVDSLEIEEVLAQHGGSSTAYTREFLVPMAMQALDAASSLKLQMQANKALNPERHAALEKDYRGAMALIHLIDEKDKGVLSIAIKINNHNAQKSQENRLEAMNKWGLLTTKGSKKAKH